MANGNGRGPATLFLREMPLSEMRELYRLKEQEVKERLCLGCERFFKSQHIGNRLCFKCLNPKDQGETWTDGYFERGLKRRNGCDVRLDEALAEGSDAC